MNKLHFLENAVYPFSLQLGAASFKGFNFLVDAVVKIVVIQTTYRAAQIAIAVFDEVSKLPAIAILLEFWQLFSYFDVFKANIHVCWQRSAIKSQFNKMQPLVGTWRCSAKILCHRDWKILQSGLGKYCTPSARISALLNSALGIKTIPMTRVNFFVPCCSNLFVTDLF